MTIEERYPTIVSHSGMTHIIALKPRFTPGGAALAAGRTQTMCEMHIDLKESKEPDGRRCHFCSEAVKGIDR